VEMREKKKTKDVMELHKRRQEERKAREEEREAVGSRQKRKRDDDEDEDGEEEIEGPRPKKACHFNASRGPRMPPQQLVTETAESVESDGETDAQSVEHELGDENGVLQSGDLGDEKAVLAEAGVVMGDKDEVEQDEVDAEMTDEEDVEENGVDAESSDDDDDDDANESGDESEDDGWDAHLSRFPPRNNDDYA